MRQLLNAVNTEINFGTIVKIDMANNIILAREEHHQEGEHHNKEAEAKEAEEHHNKEAEAKEAEEHHNKEAEGEEAEEGEEVAAFVPTVDFSAEYIIYFGAGLLSLAILAVVIIWIKGYSSEGE